MFHMAATPMLCNKASRSFVCFCESRMDRRRTIARRGLAYEAGWIAKCKLFNANCKVCLVRTDYNGRRLPICNVYFAVCNRP